MPIVPDCLQKTERETKDMKADVFRIVLVAVAAAIPGAAASTPSLRKEGAAIKKGTDWTDTDGRPISAYNGSILRVGDTYYWCMAPATPVMREETTVSVRAKYRMGSRYNSSKDLVHLLPSVTSLRKGGFFHSHRLLIRKPADMVHRFAILPFHPSWRNA